MKHDIAIHPDQLLVPFFDCSQEAFAGVFLCKLRIFNKQKARILLDKLLFRKPTTIRSFQAKKWPLAASQQRFAILKECEGFWGFRIAEAAALSSSQNDGPVTATASARLCGRLGARSARRHLVQSGENLFQQPKRSHT